ncbi:hypothetical protein PTTG_27933 [Puccinia triticina 1-1 BBBD Race 1]|uniref:Uncharacterized protein n=1 Tax=Puccinia triticina (isolate 1-1 / race 1 (BBBD)) TaxID=630390 RepID=A0A180GGB8_PUCT1|nr:hypothetical protein PTTG_27933 [Puccinia triticina 1-1 BBBD Race 1]
MKCLTLATVLALAALVPSSNAALQFLAGPTKDWCRGQPDDTVQAGTDIINGVCARCRELKHRCGRYCPAYVASDDES